MKRVLCLFVYIFMCVCACVCIDAADSSSCLHLPHHMVHTRCVVAKTTGSGVDRVPWGFVCVCLSGCVFMCECVSVCDRERWRYHCVFCSLSLSLPAADRSSSETPRPVKRAAWHYHAD